MARLLVVHHSPSGSARRLLDAVLAGTRDPELPEVEVEVRAALEARASDVLAADGVLLGTTANFGYMSGALKHFFDTVFLEVGGSLSDDGSGEATEGTGRTPYGLWVHGRYDTTGAVRSVQSIVGALPWRQVAPPLELLGDVTAEHEQAAYELGGTLAALTEESA